MIVTYLKVRRTFQILWVKTPLLYFIGSNFITVQGGPKSFQMSGKLMVKTELRFLTCWYDKKIKFCLFQVSKRSQTSPFGQSFLVRSPGMYVLKMFSTQMTL